MQKTLTKYQITAIILLLAFLPPCLSVTVNYEALNSSCINASSVISSTNPIRISIPTYSLVDIQVDLRHLMTVGDLSGVSLFLNISNLDSGLNYTQQLSMNISAIAYSLYAGSNLQLSAHYSITDSTTELTLTRSYLFENSLSAWLRPPDPLNQQQKSFLFVVTSQDFVSLPHNVIGGQSVSNYQGFFLTEQKPLTQMSSRQTSINSYSDYWNGFSQLSMPFIPYFSNCQNNGDFLHFSQMIHNSSECTLYGYKSQPIKELSFGSTAVADNCIITRNCIYDETPSTSHEYAVWSTLDSTSKYLFSITAEEHPQPYNPVNQATFSQSQLVQCKIQTSSGDNTTGQFPMKTKITLGYYQITSETRRMLSCNVQFSLYSQSSSNFQYQLEIDFSPMNHTQILLDFGFKWYIYMLVFMIIGIISNMQFIIFWIYHILTTVKQKITFRILLYLQLIRQVLKGVFMAVFLAIAIIFLVEILMNGTFFGWSLLPFQSPWDFLVSDDIGALASSKLSNIRMGRMGVSYIVISIYLSARLSPLLVGKERQSKQYQQYEILGQRFRPLEWNRGKVIFGIYVISLCSAAFLYFTFSTFFNANIWVIIVMMQIAQMVLEQVLNSLYEDVLPTLPMKLSVGVLAYLATMGAIDLYYFILGYLVDVGISSIERSYLSLIQQKMSKFVEQKNEQLHRFYINLLNDEEEEQQKKTHENNSQIDDDEFIMVEHGHHKIEVLEKSIEEEYHQVNYRVFEASKAEGQYKRLFVESIIEKNEGFEKKENKRKQFLAGENNAEKDKIDKENKKFELLNDSSAGMVQYWLQPIVVLMLWITYDSSGILKNFQIASQNCILYMLSSVILAISYQLNVFIIFHVLELYFNFDYKNLIEGLLTRFEEKTQFWITDSMKWQDHLRHMDTKMKGCNRYCLSSQMFFVVSLSSLLMYLFIIGFTTIISSSYNVFKDPYLSPIAVFWLLVIMGLEKLLIKLVYCFDIWDYKIFSEGGNRISQEQIDPPASDAETSHKLSESEVSSEIRFTFKNIGPEVAFQGEERKVDKKQVLQAKLRTICRKLEPTFERDDFRMDYAIKNKDYLRRNIEEILPLISAFPENDTQWLGRGQSSGLVHSKKKQARNIDPAVSEFVGSWLKRVEANRDRRQDDGIERERDLKRCNFCFRTWAIYYGYEGTCLECSRKIFGSKHLKEE